MALDYLAFKRIVSLIKEKIIDGKICKINQLSNEEFLLLIHNNGANYNLLICTHPNMSYINVTNVKPEGNHLTSNLLTLLRKHLDGGKITYFEQENNDRIIKICVFKKDDYYKDNESHLYVELIGRASNLILCDSSDTIVDSLKKIPLSYQNIRTIIPNVHYEYPAKPENEKLPYDLTNEMEYLGISETELINKINKSKKIYISSSNNKVDFHFIPLTYLKGSVKEYDFNIGLDEFYSSTLAFERHRQLTNEMDKVARNEIKRNKKKIEKLLEELARAKEASIYRYFGDLLLTYLQGKKIKENKVVVYDEEKQENVTIEYNPQFDLYYNANLYYKKYQKSKVALVKLQEQIDICNDLIDYFESLRFHLQTSDYLSICQIKEELISKGFIRGMKQIPVKKKKAVEKVYKPKEYKINDISIYVGQNHLQNDYLTFHIAHKTHLFLHIKDGPGSHVIVACDHVDNELLRLAANIAAYHSSYQNSSTVPVNYTLVKNVKKIPGGPIGKVIINNYKTIYVDPDSELFKKYEK